MLSDLQKKPFNSKTKKYLLNWNSQFKTFDWYNTLTFFVFFFLLNSWAHMKTAAQHTKISQVICNFSQFLEAN